MNGLEPCSALDGHGPRRLGHQPALDGIRGLSVIAVIGYHLGFFPGGSAGVTVFFALSGFLITALLRQEFGQTGTISFRNFYIRRALRLLPALVALLIVDVAFVLLCRTGWTRKADLAAVVVTLFYASNWVQAFHLLPLNQLSHTWSLAIEEQFYLLWPILLLFLCKLRLHSKRMAIVVTAAAFALSFERLGLMLGGASAIRLYDGLDTRADALLFGAVAAIVFGEGLLGSPARSQRSLKWAGTAAMAAVILYVLTADRTVPHSTSFVAVGSHTVIGVLATIVILALTCGNGLGLGLQWVLTCRPLRYAGQISYGLYLWHVLVMAVIDEAGLGKTKWTDALWTSAFTIVISAVSYRFLEAPCLRLKDSFVAREYPQRLPMAMLSTES